MKPIEQILMFFQAQNTPKKWALMGSIALLVSITIGLIVWAMSPSYGILFSHLDRRDANQLLTQLEQANIAYQVRNQGRDILIDKHLIEKTRIKLMGSDVQFTQNVGFELFDKTDFGMTDFSQKINYQRALQGELERTINSLEEVKHSRVQLTIPESHLFQQENNLPRVAVTLHLKNALTTQQVKSIQQLITASVANLPLTNVVMVDQNGNGLIAHDDDASIGHFAAKKNVERYLNEKVMQMLHQIFTDEGVMVKIDATLNYDELQRERVKPQQDGSITHEKETRHTTPNKSGKTPLNQDFMREKTWQFGKEKEQFIRANGTIERLTISVVLPQNTAQDKMRQVERMVKSVVGFNALRGDTISVEALIEAPKTLTIDQSIPIKSAASSSHILTGLIALLVLALLALIARQRVRMKQRRELLSELSQWLIEHE